MAHNDGFCMVCNEVQAPEVDHISGAHRLIHGRSMRLRNPLSAAGCHELCISFRVCVIGLHSRVLGFCWRIVGLLALFTFACVVRPADANKPANQR